jgi:hypothetical protein
MKKGEPLICDVWLLYRRQQGKVDQCQARDWSWGVKELEIEQGTDPKLSSIL